MQLMSSIYDSYAEKYPFLFLMFMLFPVDIKYCNVIFNLYILVKEFCIYKLHESFPCFLDLPNVTNIIFLYRFQLNLYICK